MIDDPVWGVYCLVALSEEFTDHLVALSEEFTYHSVALSDELTYCLVALSVEFTDYRQLPFISRTWTLAFHFSMHLSYSKTRL